jgi:hypothetical protein
MYLIELFLPLADNSGAPFGQAEFEAVELELTRRFGGVTAYPRAPASGLWKASSARTERDELVVLEVVAESLDVDWWRNYRQQLERQFRQDELLIRTHPIEVL